jgi:membrane-associated phospholipid phosphatase
MYGRTGGRCKRHLPVCLLACLSGGVLSLPLRGQEQEPKSETQQTTSAGAAKPDSPKAKDRDVSWRTLPQNFLQDQKEIWLFPTQLAKGRHWLPVVGVTGATAILIAADGHDTPYFRRTGSFEGFNDAFSGRITGAGIALVPVVFLVGGHFRKDSYAEKTALLAGEAYANGAIMEIALKMTTRRLRPSDIPTGGNFSDTFFDSHKSVLGNNSSFPSGHTTAAFAVATVFAHRYRRHRWVPWVAYGAATAVGFSRVTLQSHFPSDVFLGAALGFSISKLVVLRPR